MQERSAALSPTCVTAPWEFFTAVGGSVIKVTVDQRFQVITLRAVGNQVFASGVAAHVIPSANPTTVASLKQP